MLYLLLFILHIIALVILSIITFIGEILLHLFFFLWDFKIPRRLRRFKPENGYETYKTIYHYYIEPFKPYGSYIYYDLYRKLGFVR